MEHRLTIGFTIYFLPVCSTLQGKGDHTSNGICEEHYFHFTFLRVHYKLWFVATELTKLYHYSIITLLAIAFKQSFIRKQHQEQYQKFVHIIRRRIISDTFPKGLFPYYIIIFWGVLPPLVVK